ncbi:MAG: bifunctional diaminohydroxyphosphoribosylaminopyrimidine deaminase/5-amino-6-(5-phosphoribosylamino)uracil reductase RibD, partial [Gaiellaceae bacterium]
MSSSISSADKVWLERAIELAERGRGTTKPNPVVGCVIVSPAGVVEGEGWHERAGGPHAERVALDAAGASAREATAYVSLEPCAHEGRTPPCCDALVEAGVSRVVVAALDADPRTATRGVGALRGAGVVVDLAGGDLAR